MLDRTARLTLAVVCGLLLGGCGGGGGSSSVQTPLNPAPAVTGLTPAATTAGAAAQTLTINGSGFISASTVTFNGVAHTAAFVGATQLTIALTAADQATAGSYPVVVTNPAPGGGASSPVGFTVTAAATLPVPTLTSLAPASASAGAAAQVLTLSGANFDSASTVTYAGAAHAVTFVSATQLTIQLTAADQATAGTFPVVVSNPAPGGGASNAVNFTVTPAAATKLAITSVSSSSLAPLQSLTITGSGINAAGGAVSALLTSENGNASIVVPATVVSAGAVSIVMPPLPGSASPAFTGDTVDVQLIQLAGGVLSTSNVLTGVTVLALPALPAGAVTGDLTLYYYQTGINLAATLRSAATAKGWTALAADLAQYSVEANALVGSVTYVRNNPGQNAALTTANGITVSLDSQALALSDRLVQAYLVQAGQLIPASFTPTFAATGQLRPQAGAVSSCPISSDPDLAQIDKIACADQQYMQTYAAQGGQLLQTFGTLYYGFAADVLGGYASAAATGALASEEAINGLELAWSTLGSYVSAAGTSSSAPSPCDVIANAGAKVADDVAESHVGIFSMALNYLQLERDVNAIQNPGAASGSCTGPLLTSPSATAPSGNTAIAGYQTANAATTVTTLAAPNTQQTEPATTAVINPAPVQTFTLSTGVSSGTGSIESFPDGILCGACASDTASFPAGTSVVLTATPAAGDTLLGWSGACSGIGTCVVTMNSNQSVSAAFGPGQSYAGSFSAGFSGTFPDPLGDTYSASASGTIAISLTANANGTISGSGSVPADMGVAVVSCPAANCETLPFSETAVGSVSGQAANFTSTFTSPDGYFTMTFHGSVNPDGTITGSATFSQRFVGFSGGSSIPTVLSGTIPSLTLTPQ